ncbi:MAG: tRNA lysidine(34) synthetase TilS [Clostridia bacterium]|nr:tRNA lysidine(34) synthetase TilS [Clostridia bacterium]
MDNKIEYAICAHGMDKAYGKVIIGFSGGADSSLLLHYFSKKAEKVVCVHVNHMIRGKEADRDEEFCKNVCEKYGVELASYRLDIPALARERGKGIEETARDERYRVFEKERFSRGFDAILTAHNADDNVESVIFNLARGTGLNGLCGIKPVNGYILRPLIYLSKDEIFSLCRENNIEYVTDSTNADTDYTRNYIRHKIVPAMRELNPELDYAVSRMSEGLIKDEAFILSQAKDFMSEYEDGCVKTEAISSLHQSVRVRALKLMAKTSLDYKSLRACEDIIFNSECGAYADIGKGMVFKKERDYVHFLDKADTLPVEYSYELKDLTYIDEISMAVCIGGSAPDNYCFEYSVRLDKKGIRGDLYLRSRRDGDKIKVNNMTKKVKRILCDNHIPSHLRDKLPIICDEGGIVALPGLCIRDGCRTGKDSDTVEINFYRQK